MLPLTGINLNFTASGVDIPTQLSEIYAAGFRIVRLNVIDYSNTNGITSWKGHTQVALNMGFTKVVWGMGASVTGITSSNWNNYATALQTLAQWFQSQNNSRLEFQIGNEEELHHDGSITNATLRANLRTLATTCQAIYTVGPVSYASSIANGDEISKWGSEGIGDLDYIGFNLYGSDTTFSNAANSIRPLFGTAGYVSEWGTNNGYQDYNTEQAYANAISVRGKILVRSGVEQFYYYNYMESNNKWGVKVYPDTGYYHAAWPELLASCCWKYNNSTDMVSSSF